MKDNTNTNKATAEQANTVSDAQRGYSIEIVNLDDIDTDGNPDVVTLDMPPLLDWDVENYCGYKPKTTFWQDFSIADMFGLDAVADTFCRAVAEWQHDVVYIAELALVMSHKSCILCESRPELSGLYSVLYDSVNSWAYRNYKGADLDYYYQVTD